MAKESGLGWTTCSVDDSGDTLRAIINDVTSLDFSTPRGVQDTTGIDKSAMERLLLLADFQITLNGVFNDAASTGFHTVFKDIGSTSAERDVNLTVSGQILNTKCLFSDASYSRSASGEFTMTVTGLLSDGTAPTWS
jgi:hypothetical protein